MGKLTVVLASLLFIAGCGSAPYKTQYTFNSDVISSIQPSTKQKPYSITVSDVKSFGTGANKDMTYTRNANVIEAYTKSAWVEPPIYLMKVALADALIASNAYQDVLMAPTSIQSPYKVDATIQKMQQRFVDGQSTIDLSLMVRLVNSTTHQLVFSKIYLTTETATSQDAAGGVEAYNRALARLLPNIVRDITRH